MSFFKNIRRVLIGLFVLIVIAALAAGGFWAYQSGAYDKYQDFRWAYKNRKNFETYNPDFHDGEVIKVLDGNWIHFKHPERLVYGIRIMGMEAPALEMEEDRKESPELEMALLSTTNLADLILDKKVRIDVVQMEANRYGQAYLFLNDTNIVSFMVASGAARLNRDEISAFHWKEQYALLQSERRAREAEQGVWQPSLKLNWTMNHPADDLN